MYDGIMNIFYAILPQSFKRRKVLNFSLQDEYFADVVHAFQDFGLKIKFSVFAGAGAYQPYALSTERLNTAIKQQQFANGFWKASENGEMRAHITLSSIHGGGRAAHDFIHEAMHLYQDMYGLFFVPLKERETLPHMLDAKSDVLAILFCEAWAQTQTIRFCYQMKMKGYKAGWKGALSHPDFGYMARSYADDLSKNIPEQEAAARCFLSWYDGEHRGFYERHALNIHELNFERLTGDILKLKTKDVQKNLRVLDVAELPTRVPENVMTDFFEMVDWRDERLSHIQTSDVQTRIDALNEKFGKANNNDISDIKCGAPIYIWNRLRVQEIDNHDVPVEMFEMAQNSRVG